MKKIQYFLSVLAVGIILSGCGDVAFADNFAASSKFQGSSANYRHIVRLTSDVTNNNHSANTIADVTGLSFNVAAGVPYHFYALIPYTAGATTTGSRWSINGPATPTMLNYKSSYTLSATTQTVNYATAYDIPAACNADELTAGNVAIIEGVIIPSAAGTVTVRFASEVSDSAVVAKAGATLEWWF